MNKKLNLYKTQTLTNPYFAAEADLVKRSTVDN